MKRIIFSFTFTISFCLFSCTSDESNKNEAPTTPILVSPSDKSLCTDNEVIFQWNASTDPNNDLIKYEFQLATDNTFKKIVKSEENVTKTISLVLDKSKAYYWRVKAVDEKGLSREYSQVFSFYTEGDAVTNHLPFLPTIVEPNLNNNLSDLNTTLKWEASDVDASDVLSYDVYLGTSNPPTIKVGDNLTSPSLKVNLEAFKNYFWKVIVRDNKGGEIMGQVWNFKTN